MKSHPASTILVCNFVLLSLDLAQEPQWYLYGTSINWDLASDLPKLLSYDVCHFSRKDFKRFLLSGLKQEISSEKRPMNGC